MRKISGYFRYFWVISQTLQLCKGNVERDTSEVGRWRVAGEWRFFKGLRAALDGGCEFPESFLRKIFENREIVFFTIKQGCLAYFLWFY